jgi:hypothetical protein
MAFQRACRSRLAGDLCRDTAHAGGAEQHDMHSSPLMALLQPNAFGEMDVMDDENAWTYWSRSDAMRWS